MSENFVAQSIRQKLPSLPTSPGVYLFKDAAGDILYVGKAKSLRSRVRSHFAGDPAISLKNREMRRRAMDVDTIVVGSEAEALLLEANLIKAHRPRFNIQLRDDKRYPYIKVTVQEPFPRIFVTRNVQNDGARYFGPYTDVGPMRLALEVVKRLYPVRSCRYDLPLESPPRACLDFHIGRCMAPCVGLQGEAEYRLMVAEILDVLAGRTEKVRARVDEEMAQAAKALDFERAATLRDVLRGLEALERRQRAMDIRGSDQDVLGIARDGERACAILLKIRAGKLLAREMDLFENLAGESNAALIATAAVRFYFGRGEQGVSDIPREVLFPEDFEDRPTLEGLLSSDAGRRVQTRVPRKGEKVELVELANQNARHLLEERSILQEAASERADDALYDLQDALDLKVVPRLITCFDISHLQGSEVVGSAVVFRNGEPCKAEYRRFRVRGDWGNDDFQSMAEVVARYVRRRREEDKPLPDLLVIDGGKGQLSAAREALRGLEAPEVVVCALAKRHEEVFLPGASEPVRLPRNRGALRLLQRLRNEAHRFAITYNRKLRKRRTLASELAEIPGVGPSRQRALLARFGSVRGIQRAEIGEIAELPGFSKALAERVLGHLGAPG